MNMKIYNMDCNYKIDSVAKIVDNFRYSLWRIWNKNIDPLIIIMLNPSTANANKNDPTIVNSIKISKKFDYGGIFVLNLFAYITSNQKELKDMYYPVGPMNNSEISTITD